MNNQKFNNFLKDRRINWKSVIILFILILLAYGGILVYLWLIKDKKETEGCRGNFLFYYSESYNPAIFILSAMNLDIASEDKIIAKLDGSFSVLGKSLEKGKFLICRAEGWPCGNKLYSLDTETGELEDFLTIEEGKSFASAVFSHNKNFLAYTLYSEAKENFRDTTGEVWIYDVEKKTHRKIFEKRPLVLYATLRVLGWNSEDNKVVVREMGSDAGAFWGEIYLIDTNKDTDNYKEIGAREGEGRLVNILLGELSPNGENWLYINCEEPTHEEDFYGYLSCEEGEDILVYNFEKMNFSLLYKNLTNPDNSLRRKLRIITSAVWQDDENIIFSIPEGIYKINLVSKQLEQLYKFLWYNPDEIFKFPASIRYADQDIVIYERYNLYEGTFILDIATKKIIELGGRMFDVEGFLR